MAEIHYMTQDGLDKLKKDLADALAQRPVISAAIAEAREKGDLSENAEYDAARDAQGLLEVKIAKLKDLVANAKVIDESKIGTDKVQIMNKVKVENVAAGRVPGRVFHHGHHRGVSRRDRGGFRPREAGLDHTYRQGPARSLQGRDCGGQGAFRCHQVQDSRHFFIIEDNGYNIHKNRERGDSFIQGGRER